jgi:tetratricopeptide (TPR) repeat protein
MKKLSYIIIATLFLIAGCSEDLIDIKNPNQYTEDTYFKTEQQCEEAVNAAYAGLYWWGLWPREWYFVFDLLGNDAAQASPLQGTIAEFYNYQHSPSNKYVGDIWHSLYRIVLRSNIAITKVGEADIDENLKNRLVGEAKFLRAWSYFQLANLYGDVPLRIDYQASKNQENHNKPRTNKSKVLDLVETDLSDAKKVLPESYSGADVGRATQGAATALLGKVYLYREKYSKAITEFQAVVNSDNYSLIDNYENNFLSSHDNNSETIFAVQMEQTGGNPYWMFGGQEGWGGGATHSGRAMEYGWNDWANVYFSEDAVEDFRYDSAGTTYIDPRASLIFYGNEEIGDTTYCDHCPEGPRSYPFEEHGFRWKKYNRYEYVPKENYPQSSINGVVIRYADVLLMLAESYIQEDQLGDALGLINQVRSRVGAYEYDDLGGNKTSAMDILKRERRIELCGEQKRYFDLVRWGELQETLNAEFEDNRVKPKHNKFPIPTSELDANKALEVENNWN